VPTAREFEQLASDLDVEADRLADVVLHVERRDLAAAVDSVFLRTQLDVYVGAVVDGCRRAGERCVELATECRRRATLCRGYTDSWAVYEREAADWVEHSRAATPVGSAGPRPVPPVRPAPWVERG
jgi:hypothetical protein